jgi:hypothetical protein
MKPVKNPPSAQSQAIQAALNQAIANALEKKRKLGHYAVMWENNQVVYKGDDAPQSPQESAATPHP